MSNKVNQLVIEAVKTKDIIGLKSAISTLINYDRNFSRGYVETNLKYIKECGINIFEEFNHQELLSNKNISEYTERDFSNAIFYLEKNFCNERLEDVKKIGQVLYKEKAVKANVQTEQKYIRENTISDSKQKSIKTHTSTNYGDLQENNIKKKKLGIAICVGIVVIGVVIALVVKK